LLVLFESLFLYPGLRLPFKVRPLPKFNKTPTCTWFYTIDLESHPSEDSEADNDTNGDEDEGSYAGGVVRVGGGGWGWSRRFTHNVLLG